MPRRVMDRAPQGSRNRKKHVKLRGVRRIRLNRQVPIFHGKMTEIKQNKNNVLKLFCPEFVSKLLPARTMYMLTADCISPFSAYQYKVSKNIIIINIDQSEIFHASL